MSRISGKWHEAADNLRMIRREPLLLLSILAIFYFLLVFVVFPIAKVFISSLMGFVFAYAITRTPMPGKRFFA